MSRVKRAVTFVPVSEYQPTEESEGDYVDRLIVALRHPVPDRAGLAIDVLAYMLREPRAVQPLIELLHETEDMSILKQAVLALGHLRDPQAIPPLIELLRDEDAPLVARHAAVEALAQIGGQEAEEGLRIALAGPSAAIRKLAEARLTALQHRKGE